jgi:hypothetical protein
MVQGELFLSEQPHLPTREGRFAFLSSSRLILSLDKIVIGILALSVLLVVTYSFGIESGRRTMEKKLDSLLPEHGQSYMQTASVTQLSRKGAGASGKASSADAGGRVVFVMEKEVANEMPLPESDLTLVQTESVRLDGAMGADPAHLEDYTVQLVTYKEKKAAIGEINRLQAQGHTGFIIPSGAYFQVCANYFTTRKKALESLSKFRHGGRYADAYVRSVVR